MKNLNETEPFQQKMISGHKKKKVELISKGGHPNVPPYTEHPNPERSESAPPIGESEEIMNQQPIVVDLGIANRGQLNESFLAMWGAWVKTILERMFGMNTIPVSVRGTKREVESFYGTLQKEKRYIEVYKKYGLEDPETYRSKHMLDGAVKKFERTTNLIWPFK